MAREHELGWNLLAAYMAIVAKAVNHLKVRSCLIDGEVVCCAEKGVAAFHVPRRRRNKSQAFLYAFGRWN